MTKEEAIQFLCDLVNDYVIGDLNPEDEDREDILEIKEAIEIAKG